MRKTKAFIGILFLIPILMFLMTSVAWSASYDAVIKGTILGENKLPLVGANVILKEIYVGAASDQNGLFVIKAKPGSYTIEISFIGYETVKDKITIKANETLTKNYELKIESFKIGGIVVLGERDLLPSDAETKTTIFSGEIDHIQASSLSDVLKLVPGQRFENPGLQRTKQISIRNSPTSSDADRNAFFGTQVIIDNIPVSNNANMQIDTKVNVGGIQVTTENSGIDLRQIPADNIEKVEVIRGIPSAKYGDLTSGIVKVKTKSESVQNRFKYKYNLQNKELNLNGGFKVSGQYFNYNINYANSVRDIRIENYDYTRVAGQISHVARLFKNLYSMDNRFYYTRTFDEQGLREGDLLLSERYNKDYIIRYNHKSKFIINPQQKITFSYSLNYNRQNSYSKRLITSDYTYITDRMMVGTQEGEFFQTDTSRLWVKGRAYNNYTNLEYNSTFFIWNTHHNLLSGLTYRLERNMGPGRIFNPKTPPSINSIFRDRPRRYDDIPDLMITSFYLEDKISGKLWKEYQLNLGWRYESYGSGGNTFPHNHGVYSNPRFNLIVYPGENSQIRFGYGTTSKAPPLSMLYPNNIYFDVADINRFSELDSLRLAVVTTYIFSKENPKLKGFQQIKREMSYDQKIGKIGFTLTGYSSSVFGGFASTGVKPIFVYKYDYPYWVKNSPDTTGKVIRDSVYTTYSIYENSQKTSSHGVEFSIQTKRFSPLKMRLRLEASYNFTKSNKKGYDYSSTYLRDNILGRDVKPFWNVINTQSENLLINYKLEFTIKELGAWVTFEAQQVVFDKDKNLGLKDSLAVGYISNKGGTVYFSEEEKTGDMTSTYKRIYPDYWSKFENKQNIWLFNLRVSKSLFKGSEVSFFVNNIFNSHPLYRRKRTSPETYSYTILNPDLFFGVEYSGIIDKFFK